MRVSTFNELPVSRSMLRRFGGYCHRLYIGEDEFYDMGNLSSDCYPLLSPRRRRGSILTLEKAKERGIEKVRICCDHYNVASAKTIRANGGVLEDEQFDSSDGTLTQRYWIQNK